MAIDQGVSPLPQSLARPAPVPRRRRSARLNALIEGLGSWLLRYWAYGVTALLGSIVLLAVSVPFLFYFGLDTLARPIYFALHLICAQIPSHSFYIFGHPLGMCERNFSIYASMFVGSLLFVLSKRRLPGIPWWLWALTLVPIALDGFTQMFGWRESTPLLRVLTGTIFGLGNVLFVLPLIERNLVVTPEMNAALQLRRALAYQPLTSLAPVGLGPVGAPAWANGQVPAQTATAGQALPTVALSPTAEPAAPSVSIRQARGSSRSTAPLTQQEKTSQ
ncbi:DUF2085 domain-containing protein [Thermogemmatispora tikiterensis]|uniref:DUF2085 domain-containing protein n=1 Tax=Thermogemmatispora tikiterensis TaxID=1825093 RepID=A0A328VHV8_9CHLR|nr:DUF2085 domain-containing protein [Thermogemmatispora tikiterensis]RAQ94654.1 hypothetical protein A4R35_03845 [Thermogemmatispora tikiterensis]